MNAAKFYKREFHRATELSFSQQTDHEKIQWIGIQVYPCGLWLLSSADGLAALASKLHFRHEAQGAILRPEARIRQDWVAVKKRTVMVPSIFNANQDPARYLNLEGHRPCGYVVVVYFG
jgi:hypothetical protein